MWSLSAKDFPAAVLIRAIQPIEGVEIMSARQEWARYVWTRETLTQAMGITKSENGVDLTETTGGLWIEAGVKVPNSLVTKGPRVGLNNTPEPWLSKPWRFLVKRLENLQNKIRMNTADNKKENIWDYLKERLHWYLALPMTSQLRGALHKPFTAKARNIGISYAGEMLEKRVKPLAERIGCDWVEAMRRDQG